MKIVFATNNINKLKEVQAIVPDTLTIVSLKDIGCFEDIPETSPTIEKNAIQKAKYVKEHYGYDCFADDTGLEVPSLNNEPGVYSARYAGPERDSKKNMVKVLTGLQESTNRSAQFKTVIALQLGDTTHVFTGICKGAISKEQKGTLGFGYDPIFVPDGFTETFAELAGSVKNKISHRAKALEKLITFINQKLT
ncbi:non-canonical purine NTP diphosphatase [Aquimarina sp. W85]|uniref:non-canonical purine NTP diphosphatase n=1 Tax=Aquimarina rhodophyticola TaxID=3342246 RepID=UPI0036725481